MTPNTPPEVLALAREIAAKHDANKAYQYLCGSRDDYPDMRMIIDTIMEVTERAIDRVMKCDFDDEGDFIVSALRNWEHLK